MSIEEELLQDIKAIFHENQRIKTTDLLEALSKDDLAAWGTWNRGQSMTPRQLANKLKAYSVNPKPIKIAGVTHKGYLLSDFSDAFERYLHAQQGAFYRLLSYNPPIMPKTAVLSVTEGSNRKKSRSTRFYDEISNQ